MRFLWLTLCLITTVIHAEDKATNLPHAEVDGDPSGMVAGCVNALTGRYSESGVDLVIPGPEPLSLQRFYCSADWSNGTFCNGWTYNHGVSAVLSKEDSNYIITASEPTGGGINYVGHWGKIWSEKGYNKEKLYVTPNGMMSADQRLPKWHEGLTNTGLCYRWP